MTQSKKILVIDDEATVREAVVDILEMVNIGVLQAKDGANGLEILTQHQEEIGAILLDMRMPGLNGAEVLKKVRQQANNLYVIVSTGYSVEIAKKAFGPHQPDEFLTKPYDITDLIDRVQHAFTQTRQ